MKTIFHLRLQPLLIAGLLLGLPGAFAQTALDETSPWPRVRSTNGSTVTIYQPQVETWTKNSFTGRAAVDLKLAGEKSDWLGVVWFAASGSVDQATRIVALDQFDITRVNFPDAKDGGSNALAVLRAVVPSGARTVSLDYLITAMGFNQAAAREGVRGYKNQPPEIIWATEPTVLVLIDGEPALRPMPGSSLQRVINTPATLVKCEEKYFLVGGGRLFMADSLQGPWSLSQMPPSEVAALVPAADAAAATGNEPPPRILVRTRPAELVLTAGMPDFQPIAGTSLQYAANTDSQLFFDSANADAYLLLSGRWFKAKSLKGPWNYVVPADLPPDFAKIPPGSPQAVVLASVPGTPQAEAALIAISTPTTATVDRQGTTITVKYDGAPQFKPITGTSMSYAVNAQLPVIQCAAGYYAVESGVWFTSAAATGPWTVAESVPEEIYTIPPDSPVYFTTFVRVYDSTTNSVETGYTAGYEGAYEDDGTVVYGTGNDYDSWCGNTDYYGWGWSWGYGYCYVPWYGCWVWRDWWDHPGAPRYALMRNAYERWQDPHVTPHDRIQNPLLAKRVADNWVNYPALYGRYHSAADKQQMLPPSGTLALNPYARPQGAVTRGEIPRGATLLTTMRQSPGGGRDVYATADGQVYLRKNDGWYRRQGANWNYVAPVQGAVYRGNVVQAANLPRVQNAQPAAVQLPNAGAYARQADVSALEREYAARNLAQQRQQQNIQAARNNYNRPANVNRPVRTFGGGGRRGR